MAINYKNYLTTNITTATTVYNPTTAGIQATVVSMILANNSNANTVTANVTLNNGSVTANVVRNVTIPVGTSLNVISSDRLIVAANNIMQVAATGSVDVTISAIEVT